MTGAWTANLVVAPVLLPLGAAAVMLMLGERRRTARAAISFVATLLGLALAIALLAWVDGSNDAAAFKVYLPGNWQVPFGIVLVVDRLSALMLVLSGVVGVASLLFSLARWDRAGVQFHPLLQLQLMGLNGAFLTGDLFNLFVFFEVLLAASYGLLLHGGGSARVRAGLHYIAINLFASLLFLIGVALLYGVTGTLNMADMAEKMPLVPDSDRGLLHAGAAILAVAFLAKAAVWPLNFWLPAAYAAASTPVAALFTILTKVGVYAILRLWTLCFPATAGASALFGNDALVWGGVFTIAMGAIGTMASQRLGRLAAFSILVSSGTVIAAISFDHQSLTAGGLYYMASSTLAASALFLLVELMDRAREAEMDAPLPVPVGHLPRFTEAEPPQDVNLDDEEVALIGRAIPGALAFLGLAFMVCTLVVAGLPPLSGFVGKLAMLSALLELPPNPLSPQWAPLALFAVLLVSGLISAIALTRAGMRLFWSPSDRQPPRVRVFESLPVAVLLGACVALVVAGEPVLRYMNATAAQLHEPGRYIAAVMSARPVPAPSKAAQGDTP